MKNSRIEVALVFACVAGISASATLMVNRAGWTLYYGDAEAHLNIARRIVDSRTPGYDQIGTVWLPLPHALMLPLVGNDALWRSGLAGAIPASVCFVLAAMFLFLAVRRLFDSPATAVTALCLFIINPNLLYLQASPMTEAVLFAALMALLYFTVLFKQTQSAVAIVGAGIANLAATLTRYEGWFLIPFVAVYFLISAKRHRIRSAFLFATVASIGPLYWLAHNWWYFGDALDFYRGPYSAQAIYQRALAQKAPPYPGDHDWRKAVLYFSTAAQLCSGWVPVAAGAIGIIGVLWRRAFWPVLLLLLPPAFYVWSMYSSGTPIFVPSLWPNSYYNTRYGLAALPLFAFCGGAIAILGPQKARPAIAGVLFLTALGSWLGHPAPENWICWKESLVNSESRRAWTHEAAEFLKAEFQHGSGIFTSSGDVMGVFREAGIPLRETLNDGSEPAWMAATRRPQIFLHEEWALAIAGDPVATAVQRSSLKSGPNYDLVKTVIVKNAPIIEIYRRVEAPAIENTK